MFDAKEGSVTVQKGTIDYVVFGKGSRDLVLIPGLVLGLKRLRGTGRQLAISYRMFAKDFRIWCFDHRENLPQDVTAEQLADDLAHAMQAAGIAQADILGVSQGGMIAQYLALNHPEKVRRLVLGVTLCQNNPTVESCIARWIDLTQTKGIKAAALDSFQKTYSEKYLATWGFFLPFLADSVKKADPQRFTALAKACLTCDTYDRLPQLTCPVLVLGGRLDKIVGSMASEEIAQRLGCECHIYENLGHSAYEEAKDFNKRVYDFLTAR
ncbi:MAG: alpha/beta hydrolase [Firmicutes bacterium]|nr:alpha/beta hydrolase [Bacillota bacterium]